MASIDSSIYNQQQPADLFGSFEKGMRLGDMIKKRRQDNEIKDIMKTGMTQNPDGSMSYDMKKPMSALMDKGYFQEALDLQEKEKAQLAAQAKLQKEKQDRELEEVTRAAWSITDQPSYETALKNLSTKGIDVSQMPREYNPQMVEHYKRQTLSTKERLDELDKQSKARLDQERFAFDKDKFAQETKFKDRELGLRDKEILAKNEKASGAKEGRKALDRDYAKDYNDWTSNARNAAEKNLSRLREAKLALQGDPTLTGSVRGMMPDFIRNTTNEKAILTRDKVRAAAQGALKATLGSAFTEREGERIMNQAYNEKLSPEANIELIDKAIKEIENNMANADKKARYFQQYGTLDGLEVGVNQASSPPPGGAKNQTKFVTVIAPNGKVKNIPESMLQDAINSGGKLAPQTAGY